MRNYTNTRLVNKPGGSDEIIDQLFCHDCNSDRDLSESSREGKIPARSGMKSVRQILVFFFRSARNQHRISPRLTCYVRRLEVRFRLCCFI
jgi:hypothetical protein